jgi:RNA polymerase sigma-70 factor, ECF subfamily
VDHETVEAQEAATRMAALVTAAQAGEAHALDQLLRSLHDRMYAVCRRMLGNDADAADANQHALMAVVRGLPRFDGRASVATWAYRIAMNASLDELRRRARRPDVGLPEWAEQRSNDSRFDEQITTQMAVDAALATLPPDYRAAVVLRDLCDLDYAEIAEALDIPAGTVRSRIARGRAAVAAKIADDKTDPSTTPGNQTDPRDRRTT